LNISYLQYAQINHSKWDACIQHSLNGNVYALSWYLDIVHYGWEALVYGDYEQVMPLTPGYKFGIHYLYQPIFTQQLGVFSKSPLSTARVNEFIGSIPRKYKFIEVNLNAGNNAPTINSKVSQFTNFELELIYPYKQILANYSENTRRNLRKAQQRNLILSESCSPEQLVELFKNHKGMELNRFAEREYKLLIHLIHTCIYKGLGQVRAVYTSENELCAAAFITTFKNRTVFLFSGLSSQGKELGAMFLLLNSFIQERAETHHVFDFEGSNNPQLARFYESFGSTAVQYPHLQINKLPMLITTALGVIKKIRNR
jgi:hypothetical protein